MTTTIASGLGPVDAKIKQKAGKCLWQWKLCGNCFGAISCLGDHCPWNRHERLESFWKLYEKIVQPYVPHGFGRKPALRSYDDLLKIVQNIREHPNLTKTELLNTIFEENQDQGVKPPDLVDQIQGNIPDCPWREKFTAHTSIQEAFPKCIERPEIQSMTRSLTASRLSKEGRLRLRATNDVRRHLVLDHEERVVWIFQQESALREILNIPVEELRDEEEASAANYPTSSGSLPRQLVLEILDTIHEVLFPISEYSYQLRKSLVDKYSFDKGFLTYISSPYRSLNDPHISYTYFADILEALYKELQEPAPHGRLQRWLKRKTDTYMLIATMIGVFIAIVLGFLGLLVSTFQAYVAYQQWKYSVKDSLSS